MSIVKEFDDGWLISHSQLVKQFYSNVENEFANESYELSYELFKIIVPFKVQKAGSHCSLNQILKTFRNFQQRTFIADDLKCDLRNDSDVKDNQVGLDFSLKSFLIAKRNALVDCIGGNNYDKAIVKEINGNQFLFPRNSRFFCKNIEELSIHFKNCEQFDFILIDPPWWNKSVRRRKQTKRLDNCYNMLTVDDLKAMPINSLLNKDCGIVAVWCTNSQSQNSELINEVLPSWGLERFATWFWIKVTMDGTEVCPFRDNLREKNPYEKLIFAKRIGSCDSNVPDGKIIVSIPSLLHSHKPPLCGKVFYAEDNY